MEHTIEELKLYNKQLNTRISRLESDMHQTMTALTSLEEDVKNNQNKLQTLRVDVAKLETSAKEFFKNFTVAESNLDEQITSIQYLFNKTDDLNEKLVNINSIQSDLAAKTAELMGRGNCQSGRDIGAHAYPHRSFPYDVTIKFDPPFKAKPALSYGLTLIDTLKHTAVNVVLTSLTEQSFSLNFQGWGGGQLYGARISWIACAV